MAAWDVAILFIARGLRMFTYGTVGVILALFLSESGYSDYRIGLLLTLTLLGDSAISLVVTLVADSLGRKVFLAGSSLLMAAAGWVFSWQNAAPFWLLLLAATIGVISPSGNEVGPFMALEQSVLSDLLPASGRTTTFAWYNLLGYAATAVGALLSGNAVAWMHDKAGLSLIASYRRVFLQYAVVGVVLFLVFLLLTSSVELHAVAAAAAARGGTDSSKAPSSNSSKRDAQDGLNDDARKPLLADGDEDAANNAAAGDDAAGLPSAALSGDEESGVAEPARTLQSQHGAAGAATNVAELHANASSLQPANNSSAAPPPQRAGQSFGLSRGSLGLVAHLSLLFSLDSFAGGLVTGTLLAYYFQVTYSVSPAYLGGLLFVANLIAAVSSLLSGWVAGKIGLINTMVFTHLPSNVLLMLVPLMPTLHLATAMVFLRFSISQMDVAPRQAFVAGVVPPSERTATMGITNIAKSIGAAFGPLLTGFLASKGLFSWAFYLGGGLKIVYDLALLYSCRHMKTQH